MCPAVQDVGAELAVPSVTIVPVTDDPEPPAY
jgi:hypothetical protein